MKAYVIAMGDIVDVEFSHYIVNVAWYKIKGQALYSENELEFINEPDYWTRLEHQAAIAAMQGILANDNLLMQLCERAMSNPRITHVASKFANACAYTLVEKLKEKEERK